MMINNTRLFVTFDVHANDVLIEDFIVYPMVYTLLNTANNYSVARKECYFCSVF